jgi:hypothetical protein
MRKYSGIDEPLLIHEQEVLKVAKYVSMTKGNRGLSLQAIERLLRSGDIRLFERRVHVLR